MTQELLDVLGVHIAAQQQRRAGVTQVMKAYLRWPSLSSSGANDRLRKFVGLIRVPTLAVVKFNQDIPGIDPTKLPNLPTTGQFNNAAKGSKFTAVGYGGYLAPKEPGGPVIAYEDQREWSVGTLNSVSRTYLRLSQNQGSGGTCYGDSGGPNFLGEYPYNYDPNHVPILASTTITGDTWCKSTNVTLRLDTRPVRAFLDDYVTLP
jgi:hypothetical protein